MNGNDGEAQDSGGDVGSQPHSDHPTEIQAIWSAVSSMTLVCLMAIFCLLCAWSLTSLTCFHVLIISLAQTTNERVRGVFAYCGARNTANRGCLSNWVSALCGRRPPSKLPLDFSQLVICGECDADEKIWDTSAAGIGQLSPERISSAAQLSGDAALSRNNNSAAVEEGRSDGGKIK